MDESIQPEIILKGNPKEIFFAQLRISLREAMIKEGYLPHWKEEYVKSDDGQIIMFVNGKSIRVSAARMITLKTDLHYLLHQQPGRKFRWRRFLKVQSSFFTALVVAFFPKCPFCWAAYLSLFSSFGLAELPYQPWLLPVFIVLLLVNILSLYRSRKRHGHKPMKLAMLGAVLIISNRLFWSETAIAISGAALLIIASLWNSLSRRMVASMNYYFFRNLRPWKT